MRRLRAPAFAIALSLISTPAAAVQTDTDLVCLLVGKDYHSGTDATGTHQPNIELFGTDLGFSFRHDDSVVLLFGDTWIEEEFICDAPSLTDDTLGVIDLAADSDPDDCLDIEFPLDMSGDVRPIQVRQGGLVQNMGPLRTPLTGFSDGRQMYGLFSGDVRTCAAGPCPTGFTCALNFCFDLTSSQLSATMQLKIAATPSPNTAPEVFDIGFTWVTNKFSNPTSRMIGLFDEDDPEANDYEPGEEPGELLMWGRPGFAAVFGGTADLYLLHHSLGTLNGAGTTINWTPRYFAGMSGSNPTWTSDQSLAVPVIANEPIVDVLHNSVAWVDGIQRWVLLYSGRWPRTDTTPTTGVYMRTATHPWGPWSAPDLIWHATDDGAYDCPGGFMYHPDNLGMSCTPSDPFRPNFEVGDTLDQCPNETPANNVDQGVEYGVNILDTFTTSGLAIDTATIYWNLSTWNPYRVVLMKTDLDASVIIPP